MGKTQKAWVVAVDMGYGHQRAAFALRKLAFGGRVITANEYPGIPHSDKRIWNEIRELYEIISRFRKVPIVGDFVFSIFDKFQEIKEFYPAIQGIEPPTLQLRQMYGLMKQKALGKHLIEKLNRTPIPFLTTFSALSFMAEYWGYEGPIYLVLADADVSRAWAPLNPARSRIFYCVPTLRAKKRLERYGIPENHISCTGFPLPEELTGRNQKIAKKRLKARLQRLDPQKRYLARYAQLVKEYVGSAPQPSKRPRPVTLSFSIGGAGAQVQIASDIMESVAQLLKEKKMQLNIIVGIRRNLITSFETLAKKLDLVWQIGKGLKILGYRTLPEYFKGFHATLQNTDILWTKPSELVFYAGLGIPILIAPPLGSQEVQNRKWLLSVGAGIDQMNPAFTHQWILDLLEEGVFAEAAMQGFIEIEKHGTDNIIKLIEPPKL